ncbi:MAG: DUF2344 domain-containing protein [Anaerolineales bacterium]|nr:DUF2344 domain-containing protein [Anaerolineales bacterium]
MNQIRYRYRLTFEKKEVMRFTSHLDLHRTWERTFRRARLPLAYSQGYNPRPRLNLACALPLGYTSEGEIMDVWLEESLSTNEILSRLRVAVPPGLYVQHIESIETRERALQTRMLSAAYVVQLHIETEVAELRSNIEMLQSTDSIPRTRHGKAYDLRPLIEELNLEISEGGSPILHMTLSAREAATGRPEEVLLALGIQPTESRIHRTELVLAAP